MLFHLVEVEQEKRWKGREGIPGKEVACRKAWWRDRSWWLEAPGDAQLGPPMSPGALCTNPVSHHWWGGDTSQSEQAKGVNSWDGRNARRSGQPLPENLPVCIRTEGCGPLLAFHGLTSSLRRGTVPRQGRRMGSVGLSQGCGSPVEWAGQPALLGTSWVLGDLVCPRRFSSCSSLSQPF